MTDRQGSDEAPHHSVALATALLTAAIVSKMDRIELPDLERDVVKIYRQTYSRLTKYHENTDE